MTGLKVACLLLLVLIAVPVASARTEFGADEKREIDALQLEAEMYAGIAGTNELYVQGEFLWADASFMAKYVPAESDLLGWLHSFLLLLPQHEAPAAESPRTDVTMPDAQTEVDALMTQGIGTQGETHATNQQIEVMAAAHAGSQSHSAATSARPVDGIPLDTLEALQDEQSPQASHEEGVQDDAASAQDVRDEPTAIEPAALAATNGQEQAIVQPISLPVALATTAAVIGVSTTTAFAAVPGWRSAVLKLLRRFGWMVLFSRIAQEDILNHERRSELLEFVRNNPGERVEVARRALGFSNGSMHYHLRVLQDRGLVKILKEGSLARLYPRGPKIQPAPYVPPQRKRFLEVLSSSPGQTQRELSQTLGLSERMVSYHVQALASQGLLEVRAEGARKRLFPASNCASVPVLAPAA